MGEVSVVIPPVEGWDLRDWINDLRKNGKDAESIYETLKAAAVPYEPGKAEEEQQKFQQDLLTQLGLQVIGVNGEKIQIYSTFTRKYSTIPVIDKWGFASLVLAAGGQVKEHVAEEATRDKHSMKSVRVAIAEIAANKPQVTEDSKRGLGLWPEDGKVVLVGTDELGVWDGQKLSQCFEAVRGEHYYNVSEASPWYAYEDISRKLDGYDAAEFSRQALDLLRRWRWGFPRGPDIAYGMLIATWLQKFWTWRPQVFLSGGTGTGKSVFFRLVQNLFFGLAMKASHSTTAIGTMKRCRGASRVAILDEIDQNRHRKDLYEMVIRPAGRGDDERWTGQGDGRIEFALSQIFWLAGIESGLLTKTDADRVIQLELLEREKGVKQIVQPSPEQCRDVGIGILTVALHISQDAPRLAIELGRIEKHGKTNRACETYSVPAACYSLATGESAETVFHDFIMNTVESDDDTVSDEEELMESIRLAHVDAGPGMGKLSVSQLCRRIRDEINCEREWAALERCGIIPQSTREEVWLNVTSLKQFVLKGTKYQSANLHQYFRRMKFKQKKTELRRYWVTSLELFIE